MADMIMPGIGLGMQILNGFMNQNQQQWYQNALMNLLNTYNTANGMGTSVANSSMDLSRNSLMQLLGAGSGFAIGDSQNPGLLYQMGQRLGDYGQGLNSQFFGGPYSNAGLDQLVGQQWNMNDAYRDQFINPMGNVMGNNGILSPDMGSLLQMYQSMQNNPYLGNMAEKGNSILNNGGMTNFSMNAADRGMDVMNNGGQNAMTQAFLPFAQDKLQQNGYIPQLTKMFQMGEGYAADPTANATGPFGQTALNYGNQYLDNAQQYGGGILNQALNNGGYTGGNTNMSQRGYDLMNSGTLTPGLAASQQRGLELSYDNGYTPELYRGLDAGYGLIGDNGTGGGVGAALSLAGGMGNDPGYTDSINNGIQMAQKGLADYGMTPELKELYNRSMDLYKGGAGVLRPMDEAISQARDQAATSSQQQFEKLVQQANLRGGGAGVIGSGLRNGYLAEFQDKMAQNEAAALRDAAQRQESLFLQQELGGGENAAKAMQSASNNMSTYGGLWQGLEGDAASRHNASVNAGAQLAASAAQAAAAVRQQAIQSGASLINGLNSTAAQRYGTSLGASESLLNNANNNETQRYLGNLQYGSDLVRGGEDTANQRYGQELNTGASLINPVIGSNLIDSGYNSYGNLYNTNLQSGFNAMNSASRNANDIVGNYTNLIPQLDSLNNQRVSIYGNLANQSQQNDLSRMQFGANSLNNYYTDLLQNGSQQQNFWNTASNNYFNAGNQMNQGYNTLFNLYNNMYGNNLAAQQFGMNNNSAYANAMNQYFNNSGNLLSQGLNMMYQGNNGLDSIMRAYLGYAQTGLGSMAGLFSNYQVPQNPWSGMLQGGAQALSGMPWGSMGGGGGGGMSGASSGNSGGGGFF